MSKERIEAEIAEKQEQLEMIDILEECVNVSMEIEMLYDHLMHIMQDVHDVEGDRYGWLCEQIPQICYDLQRKLEELLSQ